MKEVRAIMQALRRKHPEPQPELEDMLLDLVTAFGEGGAGAVNQLLEQRIQDLQKAQKDAFLALVEDL